MKVGILQTTAFVGLTLGALEQGAAGRTSVLVYTMPFWLLTMAWVVLGERIRGSQWVAVGLALLGLVFILRPWRMESTAASSLLAVAAGFCWAASAVLVKILQRRRHIDLLSFTAWQMLIGAIPLVIIAILRADAPLVWNAPFVAALAFNVLPANALAWLLCSSCCAPSLPGPLGRAPWPYPWSAWPRPGCSWVSGLRRSKERGCCSSSWLWER